MIKYELEDLETFKTDYRYYQSVYADDLELLRLETAELIDLQYSHIMSKCISWLAEIGE